MTQAGGLVGAQSEPALNRDKINLVCDTDIENLEQVFTNIPNNEVDTHQQKTVK